MVRIVAVVAVSAVAFVALHSRLPSAGSTAAPAVNVSGVPAEFRAILRSSGTLPRLGVTTKLVQAAPAPFADVGTPAELRAVRSDIRREFAERRIKVLEFRGIFVSGQRALAQIVYRISTRAAQTETVTLVHEGDHWRFG